jgi:hypothetical protein
MIKVFNSDIFIKWCDCYIIYNQYFNLILLCISVLLKLYISSIICLLKLQQFSRYNSTI